MLSFLKVAPQCCDAGSYTTYGAECAADNTCYGDLRPMGDYLWFSVPHRLGWTDDSLIAANFAVTAIGILLSVLAFYKLLSAIHKSAIGKPALFILLLLSCSVHAVFLRPVIFNTLSDPPANMMLLSGVWLLVIACFSTRTLARILLFALAGLSLGLAVWLRAFYLYPVLSGLAVYLLFWMLSSKKQWMELLIILALLPIGTQYYFMHREYGTYSYLNEETTNSWSELHLNYPYVGYDTVFPRNGYFWSPEYCEATLGILNGLQARDYKSVACIVAARLYFYLGTYEPDTYLYSGAKNQLIGQYAENIGDLASDWFPQNIEWQPDQAMAPDGQQSADKIVVTSTAADGRGDVVQWVQLRGNTVHTFSVWLWSPIARTVNLAIKRHFDDTPVALQQFTLTPEPTRYRVTGKTLGDDLYDVDIGRSPYPDKPVTFGTETGDFLYAWGAQLEVGDKMTDYSQTDRPVPEVIRQWYPALLLLNCIVLVLCIFAFVRHRIFWLQRKEGLAILTVFLVAAAECVAIIPEQRFGIGLMIFFWLVAATFVLSRSVFFFKKQTRMS